MIWAVSAYKMYKEAGGASVARMARVQKLAMRSCAPRRASSVTTPMAMLSYVALEVPDANQCCCFTLRCYMCITYPPPRP